MKDYDKIIKLITTNNSTNQMLALTLLDGLNYYEVKKVRDGLGAIRMKIITEYHINNKSVISLYNGENLTFKKAIKLASKLNHVIDDVEEIRFKKLKELRGNK